MQSKRGGWPPDCLGTAETIAFRVLCEAGVLERADYLPAPENSDSFLVRVTLLGDNETKYPRPFQSEAFGPGRKDGWRPTPRHGTA
jgi:hypothetical protein